MKQNDLLQTPEYIWGSLGPFDLDPCAGENTSIAKTNIWDGRGECGLRTAWAGIAFVNPPFSQKDAWIQKIVNHRHGILLLPERGSAPWFGPLADAAGTYFVMGKKVNFIGGPSSNNVGTCLFPFGRESVNRIRRSGLPGHLVHVESFTKRP